MGRVVLERPRRGSRSKGAKSRNFGYIDREDGEYYGYGGGFGGRVPNSMGYTARAYYDKGDWEDKAFSDLLGPIEGYLKSKIGCNWDDVYSEIRKTLKTGGWPTRHILHAHIDVATCVEIAPNGHLYEVDKWGDTRRVSGFYVDPRTGKLCWAERRWRYAYLSPPVLPHKPNYFVAGDLRFVQVNGLWFKGTYRQASVGVWSPIPERSKDGYRLFKSGEMSLNYYNPEWPNYREGLGNHSRIWIFEGRKSCSKRDLKWMRQHPEHSRYIEP